MKGMRSHLSQNTHSHFHTHTHTLKGLNDNGSGSATLLEMAIQMNALAGEAVNTVRFGWWGAEEEGLLGSRYYVASLSPQERERIAVYINHDMLASPNYIVGVQNASDAVNVLQGGVTVTKMYETFYTAHKVPFRLTPLRSGSDFVPFVQANISSCGLETGASQVKTSEERDEFGGLAKGTLSSSLSCFFVFFLISHFSPHILYCSTHFTFLFLKKHLIYSFLLTYMSTSNA